MKEFKIRASASGKIMGIKGLGKTGETYCQNWLKEQLYGRKIEFTSKYTDKGNIVEDNSLDFIADKLGYGLLIKNEKYFENPFITGTPDAILTDHIIDVKNSWDFTTFPLFEDGIPNSDYFFQAQCYMELGGKDNYKLIYCLSDTPMNLIEKEAFYWGRNNGYEQLDQDVLDKFIKKMTYADVKDSLKLKVYDIKKDDSVIQKIAERVLECREYIEFLKKSVPK